MNIKLKKQLCEIDLGYEYSYLVNLEFDETFCTINFPQDYCYADVISFTDLIRICQWVFEENHSIDQITFKAMPGLYDAHIKRTAENKIEDYYSTFIKEAEIRCRDND